MGDRDIGKAVSNAGPLIHLAEINCFELLKVFSKVYVPKTVYGEVCIEGKPGERELKNAEDIEVLEPTEGEVKKTEEALSIDLDVGELDALALSNQLGVGVFLTDDLDAREAGKKLGFSVHGSAGVIARAYRKNLIDLADAKKALEDLYNVSKLFITNAIVEKAIEQLEDYKKGEE